LKVTDFTALCRALSIDGGESSRFALREQLIIAIGAWTNTNSRTQLDDLLQLIREHMMPESSRDRITKESLLARFGSSDQKSLFSCPQSVKIGPQPGPPSAGHGRTAPNRKWQATNPPPWRGWLREDDSITRGSKPVTPIVHLNHLDCFGGGTYLDSDAYRHRDRDAFTQLINEMASLLHAPLFLLPAHNTDYPRLFSERLAEASALQKAISPDSFLVVAVDAADNSVSAANGLQTTRAELRENLRQNWSDSVERDSHNHGAKRST